MPTTKNSGVPIHYSMSDREDGELLVLSNSLGSSRYMWQKVLTPLEADYRVLCYDTRGHGASSVPPGPYTLDQLGEDVLGVLDHIGANRVNFCGLSLGGLVGMWLGLHAPERLNRLILANTSARIGTLEMWENRIATVRESGMKALAGASPVRWFTQRYRETHTDEMEQIEQMIASIDPDGYCACCAVLRDSDLRSSMASMQIPTLVITGTHDPATPPSDGRAIVDALPNSEYVELDASHLSAWERADDFAEAVLRFLAQGVRRNG